MGFSSKVRSGISNKKFPASVERKGVTNMPKKKTMKKMSPTYKAKYGGKMRMMKKGKKYK